MAEMTAANQLSSMLARLRFSHHSFNHAIDFDAELELYQEKLSVMTKENINYQEMSLLVYGYIREQYPKCLAEIIQIIRNKCEVLPTFDGYRERSIGTKYTMYERMGDLSLKKIECFASNGYKFGSHYLTLHLSNPYSQFNKSLPTTITLGVMPFDNKDINDQMYEIQVKEEGAFTIKLDCDDNRVTFYKDFIKMNSTNIDNPRDISSDYQYQFYVAIKDGENTNILKRNVTIEIISTEIDKMNMFAQVMSINEVINDNTFDGDSECGYDIDLDELMDVCDDIADYCI